MRSIIFINLVLFSFLAKATSINLNNLNLDDIGKIGKEFSANFLFSEVSPAQSLGDVWGVEAGVLGGMTYSKELEKKVKEVAPTQTIDKIYHGGLFAAVTVPLGITPQLLYFPSKKIGDVTAESTGLGLKWTVTNVFFSFLPVDVAVRGHYSSSEVSYTQSTTDRNTNLPINAKVELESKVHGADMSVSYDFLILEPYVGFGYAKGKNTINTGANTSILNTNIAVNGSVSTKESTGRFFMGLQLDLWLAHITAEYDKLFGTDRYTAKVSLYF